MNIIHVAPGPKAGRGLKRDEARGKRNGTKVAPGPKAGRGLKHAEWGRTR